MTSSSSRARRSWTIRIVSALFVLFAAVAVIGSAAANPSIQTASGPPSGTPGSSPGNPVTADGPPATVTPWVDVVWPDKTIESLNLAPVPSGTSRAALGQLFQAAVVARAQAENRPVPPGLVGRQTSSVHHHNDSIGIYWCGGTDGRPYKSGGMIWTVVGVSCSSGVSQDGNIFLYWSASFQLAGLGYSSGGADTIYGATGSWHVSTWQYNSSLDYTMKTPGGDGDFKHDWGPVYITC